MPSAEELRIRYALAREKIEDAILMMQELSGGEEKVELKLPRGCESLSELNLDEEGERTSRSRRNIQKHIDNQVNYKQRRKQIVANRRERRLASSPYITIEPRQQAQGPCQHHHQTVKEEPREEHLS